MKLVVLVAALVGCGGGGAPPARPVAKSPPPAVKQEPAPPAPPVEKEPVIFHAKAQMTPAKGSKLEPFTIGFMQRQGDNALVLADLPVGVKAGTYHYVIHEAADCGPNATKAGPVWRETKDIDLRLVVNPDLTGALDNSEIAAHLDGDLAIIQHTLVMHDDKKGKPGKVLACGTIEHSED